jgi:hypothetical protein
MTQNPVLVELCQRIAVLMDEPLWRRLRDGSVADRATVKSTVPNIE